MKKNKLLNIEQIIFSIKPFKWILMPSKKRITNDSFVKPYGNYTRLAFLCFDVMIFHYK